MTQDETATWPYNPVVMQRASHAVGRREINPIWISLLAVGLCVSGCRIGRTALSPAAKPAATSLEKRLRDEVSYLASPELEGRGINTPGIDLAAHFIAEQFKLAGLKPLTPRGDYFQHFDFVTADHTDMATALIVGNQDYRLGTDFVAMSFSAEKSFAGPVVFVGYGIVDAGNQYDDYAGLDVRGKVLVVMRFEPHDEQGRSRFVADGWSAGARLSAKARAAAEHGAAAILLVNPPEFHGGDGLLPFAGRFSEAPAAIPVMQVKQSVVDAWLKQAGLPDLAALQKKIDRTGRPDSMELTGLTAQGKVLIHRTVHQLKNVIGEIRGVGPHADEYVIVGAHYDHLGYGGAGSLAPGRRALHPGADDNASGTAAVMEMARMLAGGPPPLRSILLVCFSAEETGLIGSNYFVNHPPVSLSKVAAMVNLDMVGRLRNETLLVGGTGTALPFAPILADLDEQSPLKLKEFGKGGFGPSDHLSFAIKKVPVLFLFTGLHTDYHRPTDTPDKINYDGLAQVVDFAAELVDRLSDMPKSSYNESADTLSSWQHFGPATDRSSHGGEGGASLGVVPDYSADQSAGGVRISGTVPGSPAASAGLRDGDVIVALGSHRIDNLYDLTDALAGARPGDRVEIKFLRDQQEQSAEVILVRRRSQ